MLTEKELRNAKIKLKSLSFITITREGIPAQTFYKIDWDEYEKVLNNLLNCNSEKGKASSDERAKPVTPNGQNCDSPKGEPIYSTSFDTETTTETTTESKKNKQTKNSLKSQIELKLSEYPNINIKAFNEWLEHKSYKAIAPITKLLNFLSQYNFATQQQIIDMSIMNGWQGLFPPKQQGNSNMSYKRQDEQYTRDSVNAFFEMKEQGFDITKENNGMPLNNTSTQDAEILEY
ncbi:MAG: hypothetical protein U9N42_05295 [Campylobacterota bacterium]|nr:hypothetical protein [Campylobacterota bacterium]